MSGKLINGFGRRGGVHWRDRALALGLGHELVLKGPSSSALVDDNLHRFTRDGQPVSDEVAGADMHSWLDAYESGEHAL